MNKQIIAREWLIFLACIPIGLLAVYFMVYFPLRRVSTQEVPVSQSESKALYAQADKQKAVPNGYLLVNRKDQHRFYVGETSFPPDDVTFTSEARKIEVSKWEKEHPPIATRPEDFDPDPSHHEPTDAEIDAYLFDRPDVRDLYLWQRLVPIYERKSLQKMRDDLWNVVDGVGRYSTWNSESLLLWFYVFAPWLLFSLLRSIFWAIKTLDRASPATS